MKTADLVDSAHYQGRVAGALAALNLKECAAILVDHDDEARVLAVATDHALVVFRQRAVPMARGGGYALDLELCLWAAVRGFSTDVTALVGETKDDTDMSVSTLKFTHPDLDIPIRARHQEAAVPFIAGVLERLSAHA